MSAALARMTNVSLFVMSSPLVFRKRNSVTSMLQNSNPSNLSAHCFLAADGSRGGIATAWDEAQFPLLSSHHRVYTLTTVLSFDATDLQLTLTHVYGPSDHSFTMSFLDELCDISLAVSGPWLLAGDFNLICDPSEKK
jgi:hypothetical protein